MLNCFPLRCEWDALHPVPLPLWPAPVRTSNVPAPQDVPDPVSDLASWARALGWTTLITYSEGWVPGQRSESPKGIWAVRCSRGSDRAVATREGGSWHAFWVWSGNRPFSRIPLLESFKSALIG